MSVVKPKTCGKCQEPFSCYIGSCWCSDLPQIFPLDPLKDCYCPSCLKKEVQDKIQQTVSQLTPNDFKEIKNLGEAKKLVEGIDYYINENGYHVFTEWYHLRRGECCNNNCKHCPYNKQLRETPLFTSK